jgi:hypothetical protein
MSTFPFPRPDKDPEAVSVSPLSIKVGDGFLKCTLDATALGDVTTSESARSGTSTRETRSKCLIVIAFFSCRAIAEPTLLPAGSPDACRRLARGLEWTLKYVLDVARTGYCIAISLLMHNIYVHK